MSERTARGYMFQSTAAYIDKTYDAAANRQIYESMDPRVRDLVRNVRTVEWYPVEDMAEVFRAIAHYHRETDGDVRAALTNVGKSIAETATTTFLKLILRVLTPKLFASKMADFWRRDNRCGQLQATEFDSNRMVVTLTGVSGYDYIGPVAPGFILFAFEGPFGFKNVRVDYDWSIDTPGPDVFTYDFRWET